MRTLGEVRDVLAGLRAPEMDRLRHLPDTRPVEVTTAVGRLGTGLLLEVAVEIPKASLKGRPKTGRGR